MKRLLFIGVCLIGLITASAQCAIDYNYYPIGANYGLDPDSLPDGYVGQFYDEDMTFFLPLDTVDQGVSVTFTDFHITSISLPLGLTWQCNNSANGCHYDPAVTQYGCVKISGTAYTPGNYNVQVDLVATHSLSALVGPENISFILPLKILPDTSTSSNAGFAMSNPSGCMPVTVSFSNNNPGMLSYFWDFGNGNTSTLAQPADQIYTQPGQYIVQYSAIQTNPVYFLQSIEVVSGTCSDNILTGNVDLFYTISTSSAVIQQVTSGNYITQPFPLFINLSNPLQLSGQGVTVQVWDNDDFWPFSSTEDCGAHSFTPMQQAGTFSVNGGGLSINYTVMEVPANIVTSTDTIYVHSYPVAPNLIYDTLNGLLYTSNDSLAMQWYYYNSPIPGATDTVITPSSSGLYSLLVVNGFGCTASSSDVLVVICDSSYKPVLDDNGSTAWMLDSALYTNLQWFNGSGMILGANQTFFMAETPDWYYIVATDSFGCHYSSDPVFLGSSLGSSFYSNLDDVIIAPNPISENRPINVFIKNGEFSDVDVSILDLYGKEVLSLFFPLRGTSFQISAAELSKLSNGFYFIDISYGHKKIRKKVVKSGS